MSMFRSAQSIRNVVTLFHDAKIPSSNNLLKYVNSTYGNRDKLNFDINVTEADPTHEQLDTIVQLAPKFAEEFKVKGIKRPTVVDWFNGKIAIDDEPAGKKIFEELAKHSD